MIKFEFRAEKLVLTWQIYLFKEFTDILKYDKSKNKVKAHKLLYYVFLVNDISPDNPILQSNNADKDALFRAFGSSSKKFTKKEEELINASSRKYVELNSTPEERLLTMFDRKSSEIIELLESTKPETVSNVDNGVTTFTSNSKMISDALKKLAILRKNRGKIVSMIKDEVVEEKVRGKLSLSPLSKGLIKIA